ncbi:MAG: plasmid pRiA4b ORF-3 family protein, partial [archaeon]|nr:plasmid pRiA4b ORF-3 family protein [archaeon]
MTHFKIKISLRGISHLYRNIIVPHDMLFIDLERMIQYLMEWSGGHLSAFDIPSEKVEIFHPDAIDLMEPLYGTMLRSDRERLCDHRCRNLKYIYDMGDYWIHDLKMEEVEGDIDRPRLLKGRGFADLEDTGGPYAFESDMLDPEMFTKEDIDDFNELFGGLPPTPRYKEEGDEKDKVPYNAVYSLSLAAFIPPKMVLYLDPGTGMVFSADGKDGYFPKARSKSGLIKLRSETRYNLMKELTERFGSEYGEGHFLPFIRDDDPISMYNTLWGEMPFMVPMLLKTMKDAAFDILDILNLDVYPEELFGSKHIALGDQQPFNLMLSDPVCLMCGGRLSNPRPDTDSGYREYRVVPMHTVCMTCIDCGNTARIVPSDSTDFLTYEGYHTSLTTLGRIIRNSYTRGPEDRAELYRAFMMYLVGERKDAVGRSENLLGSTDPCCRAMGATILFCEGRIGIDEVRKAVSEVPSPIPSDLPGAVILSAMAVRIGLEGEHPRKIEDFVENLGQSFEYSKTLSIVTSLLPLDHPLQGKITDMLLKLSESGGIHNRWALREDYCRQMAATGRIDEIVPESMLIRADYNGREIQTMSRYRCGVLNIGKDMKKTVKEFRGLLSDIFNGFKNHPGLTVRAAYAALVLYYLGETYSKKDLLAYSVKWAAASTDNGFMDERDMKQYLDEFFKVAMNKDPEKD